MFIPSQKQKCLLEYLVKFKYKDSTEIIETKSYIYSTNKPQSSIPKLFPGVVVLSYELTGERIDF